MRDFKTDPKIKNFNVIFHTHSGAKEFTRKWLKKFPKLHFLTEKNFFPINKNFFHKNIFYFAKL